MARIMNATVIYLIDKNLIFLREMARITNDTIFYHIGIIPRCFNNVLSTQKYKSKVYQYNSLGLF